MDGTKQRMETQSGVKFAAEGEVLRAGKRVVGDCRWRGIGSTATDPLTLTAS